MARVKKGRAIKDHLIKLLRVGFFGFDLRPTTRKAQLASDSKLFPMTAGLFEWTVANLCCLFALMAYKIDRIKCEFTVTEVALDFSTI